jgi:hypothetical protein
MHLIYRSSRSKRQEFRLMEFFRRSGRSCSVAGDIYSCQKGAEARRFNRLLVDVGLIKRR